jgi:ferritin-like metal-binding protein YciE
MKTLAEAFHHTLQDIYYAENALIKALPKVASAAISPEFKTLVQAHLAETKQQVVILDKVFALIKQKPVGQKCDAIEGLLIETEGIIADATGVALDACLIGIAQAVEHYEIARYGTLREWAKVLGMTEAHDLLSEILDMEKATNSKLTSLAVASINKAKIAA